jgi:hypothetical protein
VKRTQSLMPNRLEFTFQGVTTNGELTAKVIREVCLLHLLISAFVKWR